MMAANLQVAAVAHLFWFTNWSMGIMLSGQGAVWLGGACCWEKGCPAIPMSISGWAVWDNQIKRGQNCMMIILITIINNRK